MVRPEIDDLAKEVKAEIEKTVNAWKTRVNTATPAERKRRRSDVPELNEIKELIKKTINEELKSMNNTGKPQERSWAAVAGGATKPWTPTIAVPARFQREITVKTTAESQEASKRNPEEIVRAVNNAIGKDEAIAARRLRSGDVTITFRPEAEQYKKNQDWIKKAFSQEATGASKVFTVIAKSLRAANLKDAHADPQGLVRTLSKENEAEILGISPIFKKHSEAKFAALIVKKCRNCGGAHEAWNLKCPKVIEQKNAAKEAYAYRPRQFEERNSTGYVPDMHGATYDGFTLTRTRGRPRTKAHSRTPQEYCMNRTQDYIITVAYWNAGEGRQIMSQALEDEGIPDVIAIQEPHFSNGRPDCPRSGNYELVWHGTGRATIYMHKRINPKDWKKETGHNWAAVSTQVGSDTLTVWSVYVEPDSDHRHSPLPELMSKNPQGMNVVVGDFNAHHPLWDKEERTSRYASEVLELAIRWNLKLATETGTITRQAQGHRDSTLDLAWVDERLRCSRPRPLDWEGSDHIAQCLNIVVPCPDPVRNQPRLEGWAWKHLDKGLVKAEAWNINVPEGVSNPEELDEYVEYLTEGLKRIASAAAPRRARPVAQPAPWWNNKIETFRKKAKERSQKKQLEIGPGKSFRRQ
ncbi:DNase I-like protein [Daldinia sp. FL1419]|nr:DNase I-like protein [Daldinia sp. FL1419]